MTPLTLSTCPILLRARLVWALRVPAAGTSEAEPFQERYPSTRRLPPRGLVHAS